MHSIMKKIATENHYARPIIARSTEIWAIG